MFSGDITGVQVPSIQAESLLISLHHPNDQFPSTPLSMGFLGLNQMHFYINFPDI